MLQQLLKQNNNSINFTFKDFESKYAVEIEIDGDANNELDVISYQTEIKYFKENNSLDYTVEVTITNFLLNFEKPDSALQIIALKCSSAIEKCVFLVNTKNEILELENYQNIVDKWVQVKQKLTQEYEGETFEKYIQLFEKSLGEKDLLFKKIKKNLFVNQYFFPIFNTQFNNLQNKQIESFNFFGFDYQEDVIVEIGDKAIYDENEEIVISKKIIKTQNNTELFPVAFYETNYHLNKNLSINKIEGQFINHGKKYNYKINTIPN